MYKLIVIQEGYWRVYSLGTIKQIREEHPSRTIIFQIQQNIVTCIKNLELPHLQFCHIYRVSQKKIVIEGGHTKTIGNLAWHQWLVGLPTEKFGS